MAEIQWSRYPLVAGSPHARTWLTIRANLQLARNTIEAYGRALEEYLAFTQQHPVAADLADREHISRYVRHLAERPNPRGAAVRVLDSGAGLANATMQLKLTAVRLYYDYLTEIDARQDNPVGRGRYTRGGGFGGGRARGLIPRYEPLPWIPGDEEYRRILDATRREPLRNQFMLMLAYNCALRREELCALTMADVQLDPRGVRVRAEVTKGRRERFVVYSDVVDPFYACPGWLADPWHSLSTRRSRVPEDHDGRANQMRLCWPKSPSPSPEAPCASYFGHPQGDRDSSAV